MANYTQMLLDLRQEHERIGEAIHVLERLAVGQGKRRGRPPKWMQAMREGGSAAPQRKRFSVETRRKMAQAQKARWAARKSA